MIILCLEKVNILFNQPDREWVAISMHFLETGIQGAQMERSFCFFFLGCCCLPQVAVCARRAQAHVAAGPGAAPVPSGGSAIRGVTASPGICFVNQLRLRNRQIRQSQLQAKKIIKPKVICNLSSVCVNNDCDSLLDTDLRRRITRCAGQHELRRKRLLVTFPSVQTSY